MPDSNTALTVGEYLPCEHCGDPMLMRIKRDLVRKKFCATSCRQKGRWARGEMREHWARAQQLGHAADKPPRCEKSCDFCGEWYLPRNGRSRWCPTCCPDRVASARLQRYNLNQPVFDKILAAQGGGCKLCGSQSRLTIDHDHSCCLGTVTCGNCVRGILCSKCNMQLAVLERDPEWLAAAINYLGDSGNAIQKP